MFLYPEPVEFVARIVKEWPEPPVIMYDMAHVLGLYGAFQEPLKEGADVVTGSTHKTFFGPQRGVIAGSFPKDSPLRNFWADVKSRAFPGSTSNHHLGTLVALLLASYEMNAFKAEYQKQVRANAKAFAKALKTHGIAVEGEEKDGFTETHQVLVRVRSYGPAQEIARRLEENNIVTNYQALPDDETFLQSSGLRMGVQEMTRFGMLEKDFDALAGYIADVVIRNRTVRDEVRKLRQDYLEMKFCLPAKEAVPLAARILRSVFPRPGFIESLVEELAKGT
jgi:glycine/serine hydroxymethyltransferase